MADLLAGILGIVAGWVPERQPWRAIVTGVYLATAAGGLFVFVVLAVRLLS